MLNNFATVKMNNKLFSIMLIPNSFLSANLFHEYNKSGLINKGSPTMFEKAPSFYCCYFIFRYRNESWHCIPEPPVKVCRTHHQTGTHVTG